ncbi:MAG: hypothetical protein ABSF38_04490 [Verrucomicrobiota bacterium]|jgi:hypothetical protein
MKTPIIALGAFLLAGCVQVAGAKPPAAPATPVTLTDFKLVGNLSNDLADFTLTATAHVLDTQGGALDLLYGPVALTEIAPQPYEHIRAQQNHFVLAFDRRGDFPLRLRFSAAVQQVDGWNTLDFHVAPSVLQPFVLQGLAAETQFQFPGAARPDRRGGDFLSYLPASGAVKFSWKEARPEAEGKLFFSAEMSSQINVLPGLMRQTAQLNFKIMQGELSRVSLLLRGDGEVTRVVQGNVGGLVLAWNVEPVENSPDRRLVIQLNQPQKDQFSILVQTQTPLGAFPQTADVLQLRPENATRFAGYFRIVNEGAVRLEIAQASGMSQISPDQFPETDASRAVLRAAGSQRFVFRFAGADFALRIQADQILPELAVSERLAYHHGENELVIDAQIELDIREAPLRELLLKTPKGYALAQITASGLSDYFLTEPPGETNAELRLVYGQPVYGRQLVQLRLEHNQGLDGAHWTLPRLEVVKAKSVRGFVGVASDPGFRVTPEPGQTQGLTDIATAFFPGKLEGIQAAFRLTDAAADSAWQATLLVERLPQTVQADALHLFSIGEGIAYGSSLINYVVSGAPVASFKIELSDEYYNVEFTGKDIRNWQKTNGGYVVQLHTPAAGAYTLLATYDRPFKAQGETLLFTGARPLDAQSEQGYTLIISAYQFQVRPTDVSAGLQLLEPGEVPPEYRLFFDAPILTAYRYASRPFNLKLTLSPLVQGDSVSQIVDRASYQTTITKEGQVLTSARYFIKNRGNPNFRLSIPQGTQLWSASINGAPVVPVSDGKTSLVPLPQSADPNAVLELNLTLAAQSRDPENLTINAPIADAPVMLAEWKMAPDPGQRLVYRNGSLKPAGTALDISGFAQLARLSQGDDMGQALTLLFAMLGFVALALAVWHWVARSGACLYDATHICSLVLGLLAFALVLLCTAQLTQLARAARGSLPAGITFLAPVQQSGSALWIGLSNLPDRTSLAAALQWGWPALAALALWFFGWMTAKPQRRAFPIPAFPFLLSQVLGWTLLAWAALNFPNGAPAFFWILSAFLVCRVLFPALRQLSGLPRRPAAAPAEPSSGPAPATFVLLAAGLYWMSCAHATALGAPLPSKSDPAPAPAIPDSVTQTIRVEDNLALATAQIRWQALRGQALPLLSQPAVLTHIVYPTRSLKLEPGPAGSKYSQQIVALENGAFDIEVQYQIGVSPDQSGSSFFLPAPYGLINRLTLTVVNLDVDVISPEAVSIQCDHASTNTVATLVLSPSEGWINWRPRSRDVKREKPVFYAEMEQLLVPSGGVMEGADYVSIRPAQGELAELSFNVPTNATVTDVIDPAQSPAAPAAPPPAWRFDPDTRKLRVTLNPALSRPFALLIRSQVATGPLPFEQTLGLISVDNAAGQIVGVAGLATTDEVQLNAVTPQGLSPINLEDFRLDGASAFRGQIPGLTLRRAFRYSDPAASLALKASAVEPDIRVQTSDTLSLGEDHTTLADSFTVDITRAGIFNLSFLMPKGFDVDSISGTALSQWTESKTNDERVITLHLSGKTQGSQQFDITLAGPGVKSAQGWKVPQVALREANKQHGTLLIVPEQGMGLQAAVREGYTQLDPLKSGVRQIRGMLAFNQLQVPSTLTLDIDQVDPWIEVTSLQHAAVREAQLKITANLLYQIKNAGLKGFRVFLPTNTESVRFQGQQVSDFLKMPGAITNGLQEWEVKLDRRVIGQYLLQVTYQTPIRAQAAEATLDGVQAAEVNLQRGFVTVQSDPRLQVAVDHLPAALQLAEWQSIPRVLEKDLASVSASLTYRLLEPAFQLPLKLQRHEATRLLPAHVNNINFNSVISDDGAMLTRVRLEILPGDKRLLNLTLPHLASFWFAFVNDNGVWPWRQEDKILIPLEQQSHGDKPVTVEVFYECQTGTAAAGSLDLELLAPKFDLPLENITWLVSLGEKWRVAVKHTSGYLQLQRQEVLSPAAALDAKSYLQTEDILRQARTQEAQQFYALGNSSLQNGNPQQARRAFQAAYGLSTHDAAFNEDARVQLHNIKLQQALIGLNARQSAAAGDAGALGGKLRDLRNRPELNYTQQDAKDILDSNSADENATDVSLAEKLIQQQDAAVSHPAGIRASIPQQGRLLTFQRAVAVDPWTDLRIGLQASIARTASLNTRLLILAAALLAFALFALAARSARLARPV